MGRKAIYTPEERIKRKRESDKKSGKKREDKKNIDPVLKSEAMKNQVEANSRYLAKVPAKKKREKWAEAQSTYRMQKKELRTHLLAIFTTMLEIKREETNTICRKRRGKMLKEIQMKVSSEQAEEL